MIKEIPKILVVDDEPDVTSYCQAYFGRRGYLVNTTASGIDAVSMVKTLKPDLIILDRSMPDMNGKEVLRAFRKFDKAVKVVILTGHSLNTEEEKADFQSLGISSYLEKPVDLQGLEIIVKNLLGDKANVADIRKAEISVPLNETLRPITHKMKNVLGNMKNECQLFLLNKKDGLYKDKSKEELQEMADKIIADVVESIDQAIEVFNRIKED